MRDLALFRELGFVRLGDYVVERLGLSYRTAQELMRAEEKLERLPLVAAAYEAGEISAGHVRLLTRVAEPSDEAFHLGLARRSTVRELAQALAARDDGSTAGREDPRPDEVVELDRFDLGSPAWISSLWRETVSHIRWQVGRLLPRCACFDLLLAEYRGSRPLTDPFAEPREPGSKPVASGRMAAVCPPSEARAGGREPRPDDDVRVLSDAIATSPASEPHASALPLARRAVAAGVAPGAENQEPAPADRGTVSPVRELHASAPSLACRALSQGAATGPQTEPSAMKIGHDRAASLDAEVPAAEVDHARALPAEVEANSATAACGPYAARLESEATGTANAGEARGGQTGRETAGPDNAVDARALDGDLRRLAAQRQRQEAALGEHLHAMREGRTYWREGSPSLEAYARDRLELSPRRLYYLLALRRTLTGLPLLRGAYLSGRLTLRQALLIGKVAAPETEREWIQRAASVTFRRLEEEISYWLHLKETRPAVWEFLQGDPLPEGLVLTPGQPPRLHVSAHTRRRCRRQVSDPAHAGSVRGAAGRAAGRAPRAVSCEFVTAEMFLCALQEDEETEPLPPRMCRIRMRLEPGVRAVWEETVAECRKRAQRDLDEWEVFALVLHDYWKTWDTQESRRQGREHSTLERDGWRCTVPGCRSIGSGQLHEHHIVFRSLGGAVRQPRNVTTLCSGHHLGLLHQEKMRCRGHAPDGLEWELGLERGREPFLIFKGERRTGGAA